MIHFTVLGEAHLFWICQPETRQCEQDGGFDPDLRIDHEESGSIDIVLVRR